MKVSTEELFASEREEDKNEAEFVLDNRVIAREQAGDKFLNELINKKSLLIRKDTRGDRQLWLVRTNHEESEYKIYMPAVLRKDVLQWYHVNLQHPGIERIFLTIKQNFLWPGLKKNVTKLVQTCQECQKNKVTGSKAYGAIAMLDDRQLGP